MDFVTQLLHQINPWIILFASITCGSFGTICLKLSNGFRRFWAVIGVGIGYGFSFSGLTLVLNRIDIGVGYAVWSGLSTVIISLAGVFFLKESINLKKILSLLLIVIGIVGLQLSSKHKSPTINESKNSVIETSINLESGKR